MTMREYLKRGMISFTISMLAGLVINLLIDSIAAAGGGAGFISMSPDFLALFPTPAVAAYVNVLLYGVIGFTFSVMTFVYDLEKISFLAQSIIYFAVTAVVCLIITMLLWQLQKSPAAFIGTLTGYAVTHVIIFVMAYRRLKKEIGEINELSTAEQ